MIQTIRKFLKFLNLTEKILSMTQKIGKIFGSPNRAEKKIEFGQIRKMINTMIFYHVIIYHMVNYHKVYDDLLLSA
jgi:hypothetical protein